MASISISLSDDELRQLQTLADRLQVRPEELLRAQVCDILSHDEDRIQNLCQAILSKNSDLYRRLAE